MARMKMNMGMRPAIMGVYVNVHGLTSFEREIQQTCSQRNDHQGNAELENIGDTLWNRKTQYNHKQTCSEKRCRVTQAPKCANSGGLPDRTSFADNSRDSGKVVRFCRVFQSQCKTQSERRQNRILHWDENLYWSCEETEFKNNSGAQAVVQLPGRNGHTRAGIEKTTIRIVGADDMLGKCLIQDLPQFFHQLRIR